jgi:hypothetical protein
VNPGADVVALSVAVLPFDELASNTVNVLVAGPDVMVTVVVDAVAISFPSNAQEPVVGVSVSVTATPATDVNAFPYWSSGTLIENALEPFFGTVVGNVGLYASATPLELTAKLPVEPENTWPESLTVRFVVAVVALNSVTVAEACPELSKVSRL